MIKQPMPGMTDTLEFVKNLWGGMQIPGTMPGMSGMPGMPPMPGAGLSVEDLDKKIADLKAVESWLNLNMGMLRGSIQALEIQRGTLLTLKAMGDSMAQAMSQTGAAGESAMAPFAQFFAQSAQGATTATPPSPSATSPSPSPGAAPAGAEGDAANAAMPAAVAWWNLLQDQFRQAVAGAMPAEGARDPDKGGGSPLDVSGGAPADAANTGGVSGKAAAERRAGGGPAPGKRTARSKADKA